MPDPTTPTSAEPPDSPADPLMTIVIAFLAPMFLWAGDIALARTAAIETLDAYRISSHHSLITAAKIIAFELAALCSLSQSMAEDIAVPLALRLRGNAISMDRAAERNRQALENEQRAAAIAAKTAHLTEEAAVAAVAEAQRAVRDAKISARAAPPPAAPPQNPAPSAPPGPAPQNRAPAALPVPPPQVAPAPTASPAPAPQLRTPTASPTPALRHPAPVSPSSNGKPPGRTPWPRWRPSSPPACPACRPPRAPPN